MNHRNLRITLALAALTALSGLSAPTARAGSGLDLSEKPLLLGAPVKPSFIMALDDSGSMNWETLSPNQNGAFYWNTGNNSFFRADGTPHNSGSAYYELFPHPNRATNRDEIPPIPAFGFARSHQFNPSYYNPGVEYRPWGKFDGTEWESLDTPAEWAEVKVDARAGTSFEPGGPNLIDGLRYSLTADTRDRVDDGNTTPDTSEMFRVRQGMVIPAGTTYYVSNNCGGFTGAGSWRTLNAPLVVTGTCYVGFQYFIPTYYLTTPSSPDGNNKPTVVPPQPGGPNVTLYRYEIRPGNYPTTAQYNAAITNFANWFSYYRSRNQALIAALTRSLQDVTFMRIGAFTINNRVNPVVMHDMEDFRDDASVAGRRRLFEWLYKVPANGGTPNAYAVAHVGEQFRRTSKTNSPESDPPVVDACQINGGMLFTDGYSNGGRPTSYGNVDGAAPFGTPPFSDGHSNQIADIAAYYYKTNLRTDLPTGQVPVPAACSGPSPDRRLDCNRDQHMRFYGITLGATGREFGVRFIQDPDTFVITPDPFTTSPPPNWLPFNNDQPEQVDDLWHATLNGRGLFVNATSPERVAKAMKSIIESITNAAQRSSGVAGSSGRLGTEFAVFVPEYDPNSWTGDLKAYTLDSSGNLDSVIWSAVDKLPAPASRQIFFSKPKSGGGFELKPFTASNLGSNDSARIAALGVTSGDFASGGEFAGRSVGDLIDYLRGDDRFEGSGKGMFRSRVFNSGSVSVHRPIGDIYGSQAQVLERRPLGYADLPRELGGRVYYVGTERKLEDAFKPGTYSEYVFNTKTKRKPVVVVGANDGMLHGFDASKNASTQGRELFAVIPNPLVSKMGRLARQNYKHTYYADGTPLITDACIGPAAGASNCSWKSVLVSGFGTGARSVIAMDVTDPATSFGPSNWLWEFNATQDPDLGYLINRPRVFIGEDGKWYAAFANGLNSDSHRAYVFVLDLKTGQLIRKFALGTTGSGSDPNGAVSVFPVDGDGEDPAVDPTENNLLTDTLYAADYHGRIWKIDIKDKNPVNWTVTLGGNPFYTAQAIDTAERSDKRQFITAELEVTRHPIRGNLIYFGTGRFLLNDDVVVPSTPQVQTFYAIWDDPDNATSFSGRAALQEQKIIGVDSGYLRVSSNPVNYLGTGAKRGWYLDLYQSGAGGFRNGMRIVRRAAVGGNILAVNAFRPAGTRCRPDGENFTFTLDAFSGTPISGGTGPCSDCAARPSSPGQPLEPPVLVPGPPPGGGPGKPCIPGTPGCTVTLPPGSDAAAGTPCRVATYVLGPDGATPIAESRCGRQAWWILE
ncbi:MAG: pilus biosynthesis protein [Lysobacteraceae bacterium]|nr:MAG: pilus biosynthesis protein [Xanthomonadaceae bacterium]